MNPQPAYLTRLAVLAFLVVGLTPTLALAQSNAEDAPINLENTDSLNHFIRETWTTRRGLPHNSVNAIEQDQAGYLWLGTWQGPTRFNGRTFEIFDDVRVTGLPDIGIFTVDLNPCNGSLYVGGARGGISRYDDGHWRKLEPAPPFVNQLNVDEHCNLWVSSSEQGLLFYENDQRSVQFTTEHGLPSNAVYQSLLDPEGNLWVATSEGLAIKRFGDTRFTLVESVPRYIIRKLHQAPDGTLYVGTQEGIYKQTQGVSFQPYLASLNASISALHHSENGDLWIGTYRQGVWRLSQGELESLSVEEGLPNSHVLDIEDDHEGSIWVSTHGGLVQFRDGLFTSYTSAHGLTGDYARAVFEWDNAVYVGTSRGVSRIAADGIQEVGVGSPLAGQSVLAFQAYDGNLVIGTYTGGAFVWDGTQVVSHMNTDNGLPDSEVRKLAVHPDYGLLLGGPVGVTLVQPDGDITTIDANDGLHNNYTTALMVDSNGVIWTGSVSGVSKIMLSGDPNSPSFTVEPVDLSELNNAQLAFQIVEKAGYLWFATDRGLITLNLDRQEWRVFNRDTGLPFDNFLSIAFDGAANLWLGSNRGAVLVPHDAFSKVIGGEADTLSYQLYTEVDGMSNSQVNSGGPSMFESKQGNLWFATAKGVSVIDPNTITELAATPPPTVVAAVTADGHPIDYGQQLDADTQRLAFEYAGLGYLMSDHINYQVRLVGFDTDWVDKQSLTRAEYTALPANDYLFQVRASYPGGQWSEPATFAFSRSEHFWQRPLTWLILALGFLLTTFVVVRTRIRFLSRSREQLEAMVREKTAELETIARQDPLTGLGNRRAFDEHLRHEIKRSQRNNSWLALAILDIDFFKQINDRFLHTVGDQVLIELSKLLTDILRDVDYAARWGGEEFAILLPDTGLEDAVEVAERLRIAIEQHDFSHYLGDSQLTVSIGVASNQHYPDHSGLLVAADQALYQAKANGRNRTEYK